MKDISPDHVVLTKEKYDELLENTRKFSVIVSYRVVDRSYGMASSIVERKVLEFESREKFDIEIENKLIDIQDTVNKLQCDLDLKSMELDQEKRVRELCRTKIKKLLKDFSWWHYMLGYHKSILASINQYLE